MMRTLHVAMLCGALLIGASLTGPATGAQPGFGVVPAGGIYFMTDECPPGTRNYTEADGRMLLAHSQATTGTTSGSPYSATGGARYGGVSHSHSLSPPSASYTPPTAMYDSPTVNVTWPTVHHRHNHEFVDRYVEPGGAPAVYSRSSGDGVRTNHVRTNGASRDPSLTGGEVTLSGGGVTLSGGRVSLSGGSVGSGGGGSTPAPFIRLRACLVE